MSNQKQKFKSAAAKAEYEQNQANWDKMMEEHTPKKPLFQRKIRRIPVMPGNPRMNEIREIKSFDSGHMGAVTTGVKPQVYTGDKIIGIATMHKSNLVPIFNNDAAKDVSSMRR